ncbi:hypothetical protein Poli38472_006542 [Pythium oligandrum]|uniref:Uncharacterized protein n=1 Tax=Pythium oligandrum TaxID=41045 RepID=A0A8K1C5P0_PYTOL|nr:hypothetical protein Poli38472_006542 [Pythium oligandrum]|eukprot:TMW56532.1 hypothetical protein Poli38472_006542 [Pythium oligandrum]
MKRARPLHHPYAATSDQAAPATHHPIGTWAKDEHDRFLEAMKLYPRGPWKDIADHVRTRSVRQVQTHAQKYQEKLDRRLRGLRKPNRNGVVEDVEIGHRLDLKTIGKLRKWSELDEKEARKYDSDQFSDSEKKEEEGDVDATRVSIPSSPPSDSESVMSRDSFAPVTPTQPEHTRVVAPVIAPFGDLATTASEMKPAHDDDSPRSAAHPQQDLPSLDESLDFLMEYFSIAGYN